MQHFTHFGSLEADFGYVKAANKQLKRLNEINRSKPSDADVHKLGITAFDVTNGLSADRVKQGLDSGLKRYRTAQRQNKKDSLSSPFMSKIRERDNMVENEPIIPKTGWSDVRYTKDNAASNSGYLGFRTDPHQGYGGMMEEPLPLDELFPKGRYTVQGKTKQMRSRITGKMLYAKPLNSDYQ